MKFVSILNPKLPHDSSVFTTFYMPKIAEQMENPDTHFLLSDTGYGMSAFRYLKNRKFTNFTIYHIGEKPKIKVERTKRFTTYLEVEEALKQDGSVFISHV